MLTKDSPRILLAILLTSVAINAQKRLLTPEDLFRVRQLGAITWSPNSRYATVELSRPGKTLDLSTYPFEIALLDTQAGTFKTLTPNSPRYTGFFGAVWSPESKRLAFMSIDARAVVRAWSWTTGSGGPPVLLAALGYAVLLPSMPAIKNEADAHRLDLLANGVLPAVDAAIEKGYADPSRIALMGQSDGGFATLGLITQTTRFRSAIASASYSDATSLYGTFYGQHRYGDAGLPEKGTITPHVTDGERCLWAWWSTLDQPAEVRRE